MCGNPEVCSCMKRRAVIQSINVLSLFDGMSCGQIALERVGIPINKYYASEIDKYAIKVARKNYPKTIQLGDVCDVKGSDLPKIDLLIGGSPCQGFSKAGKGLNFDDPRSKLFFEYVRLWRECKPRRFLLENVKMKQEFQDIISEHLGVKPFFINSRLVSAQDRKRFYWTNIPGICEPEDRDISFSDICEDDWFAATMRGRRIDGHGKRADYDKDVKIVQYIESRLDNKTNCLTTVGKDNIASKIKVGRTPLAEVEWRHLTSIECERLQTIPDGYTDEVSRNQAKKMLGNGWTVDVIAHIFRGLL